MALLESSRTLAIETPLGEGALVLRSMSGTEQLGRLYQFRLELYSENQEVAFKDIVGTNVTVRLERDKGGTRYFNGYVSRFLQRPPEGNLACYEATVVPWLWFLSRVSDCRIFQDKTVPEIIKAVFNERGFSDFEERYSQSYSQKTYCVQYRETDLNFISRLMEEEGIYFFFQHENGKHSLILADSASAHNSSPEYENIPYRLREQGAGSEGHITDWHLEQHLLSGVYANRGYDHDNPASPVASVADQPREHAQASYEIYEYTGDFSKTEEAERYARLRMEEIQAGHEIIRGRSLSRGLLTGAKFSLRDHPRNDQNRGYLVTAVHHELYSDSFSSGTGKESRPVYACSFSLVPENVPFRSPRLTPVPRMTGPQTAIVTGPSGEEIHTDEFGRVKVQMNWDRDSQYDENSSCWVRVSQQWAGGKWGALFLPRIGQEVIVDYIDGDPSQPIITGRVYNGKSRPPYDLPGEKTRSGIRTKTDGDATRFNELRFEDKQEEEEVYLRAQRNLTIDVLEEARQQVGADSHLTVKNDHFLKTEGKKDELIEKSRRVKIMEDDHLGVVGDSFVKVEGNQNLTIKKDHITLVEGASHEETKSDHSSKVGGTTSLDTGKEYHLKAGMKAQTEAGMEIHLKSGMKLILEAGVQLSLKVGGNFIDLNPAGVFISGTMVNINSGGSAGSGSGASPQAPTAPTDPESPDEALVPEAGPAPEIEESEPAAAPERTRFSPAAAVLAAAAAEGTPFCEECARAAEEEADDDADDEDDEITLTSVELLDGDDAIVLANGVSQFVNLPRDKKWVDGTTVTSLDRLGPKPRIKVLFNQPGSHGFSVLLVPDPKNVAYSEEEQKRNGKFAWQELVKHYTTDSDGTKILPLDDFFFSAAGLDSFKVVAQQVDSPNYAESPSLTARRLVYLTEVVMKDMDSVAENLNLLIGEFARHGIDLKTLPRTTIEAMPNIGLDSDAYKAKCLAAFQKSDGKGKVPYSLAVGYTGHLAVKNSNVILRYPNTSVGPDESDKVLSILAAGLRSGDSDPRKRALWRNLVPNEDWFVSASFIYESGQEVALKKEHFTPVPNGSLPDPCYSVSASVAHLEKGKGRLVLEINVVDRMRGGLSFGGTNLVCVCTKSWWRDKSSTAQNETLIHEIGHSIGMVAGGGGKGPDKVATHYLDRGHVGNHCHFGVPLADSFVGVKGSKCVMFGSTNNVSQFCQNCAPAVRKTDLSEGWK